MKFKIQIGKQNAILRAKSEAVLASELKKYLPLAEDMVRYVRNEDNGCVGVAAPQVGVNKRIIAVSLLRDYEDENFRTVAMINPEILESSDERDTENEGCLSVPGEHGDVERSRTIKVRYLDQSGKTQTLLFRGLSARIIQHEIDHLDGVLFTDKIRAQEEVPVMQQHGAL